MIGLGPLFQRQSDGDIMSVCVSNQQGKAAIDDVERFKPLKPERSVWIQSRGSTEEHRAKWQGFLRRPRSLNPKKWCLKVKFVDAFRLDLARDRGIAIPTAGLYTPASPHRKLKGRASRTNRPASSG